MFWPYHCVEEEEMKPLLKTASKTSSRAITRRRGDCPRTQTRSTRHTRLLHPDELTRPEYQTTRPMCQTWIKMTSSWRQYTQSAPSQHAMSSYSHQTRHHSGSHRPRHQPRSEPRRVEPSQAASWERRFCAAESTCNRIWDWIWAVDQARIVLIKS